MSPPVIVAFGREAIDAVGGFTGRPRVKRVADVAGKPYPWGQTTVYEMYHLSPRNFISKERALLIEEHWRQLASHLNSLAR